MAEPASGALRDEIGAALAHLGMSLGTEEVEPLGGVGLMGRVARVSTATGDSVVVKLPSLDPRNHGVAVQFGYYEREATFYSEVAPLLGELVPRCHGVVDRGSAGPVIIMEDRTTLATADQLTGATVPEAERAIDAAAGIHAATWAHPLIDIWRLPDPLDPKVAGFGSLFELTWPGFKELFADLVDAEVESRAHELMSQYDAACAHLAAAPNCLVHGDFRLDNLLLAPGAAVVVDWQLASVGSGAYDVCRFLVGSLTPEAHAEHAGALLDRYLAGLHGAGVRGYTRGDLDADVAAAFVTYLPIPVTVAVGVESLDERGARLKRVLAERLCAAIRGQDLL